MRLILIIAFAMCALTNGCATKKNRISDPVQSYRSSNDQPVVLHATMPGSVKLGGAVPLNVKLINNSSASIRWEVMGKYTVYLEMRDSQGNPCPLTSSGKKWMYNDVREWIKGSWQSIEIEAGKSAMWDANLDTIYQFSAGTFYLRIMTGYFDSSGAQALEIPKMKITVAR